MQEQKYTLQHLKNALKLFKQYLNIYLDFDCNEFLVQKVGLLNCRHKVTIGSC